MDYPIFWWLDFALLAALILEAYLKRTAAWTRPAIAVYLTVGFWYLGDYAYSLPEQFFEFDPGIIDRSFQQVGLFLVTYRAVLAFGAGRLRLNAQKIEPPVEFSERSIRALFGVIFTLWLVLFIIGLSLADWQVLAVIVPPLAGERVSMFYQGGIGGGLSFLLATAAYIYMALCGFFGVGFSLSSGPVRSRFFALMVLTWPYFLFAGTRNVMLAIMLPGILCYMLLRTSSLSRKTAVVVLLGLAINGWFLFAGKARTLEGGLARNFEVLANDVFATSDSVEESSEVIAEKHGGLDMFKELCYMNTYLDEGSYEPNWGQRYLGEFLNFVPRAIWPGKPKVGFDYAIARGYASQFTESGLSATISTGLIGQGLSNFGPILGVVAAATMMTLWTLILARLWTQRKSVLRVLLFVLGLALTFNIGRDITLLVLWPFVFAYIGVLIVERNSPNISAADAIRLQARQRIARSLAGSPPRRS